MEEYKEKILDLIHSIQSENLIIAIECAKTIGLTKWLKSEVTELITFLEYIESTFESQMMYTIISFLNTFNLRIAEGFKCNKKIKPLLLDIVIVIEQFKFLLHKLE